MFLKGRLYLEKVTKNNSPMTNLPHVDIVSVFQQLVNGTDVWRQYGHICTPDVTFM
jgi:hypothetical protein